MDFSKIFIKDACPTKIGGQAILEGIMMKGPDRTAVVVRKPDGRMHIKVEPLKSSGGWKKIPILRGVVAFVEALVTGTQTLLYSAEVLESCEETGAEEQQAKGKDQGKAREPESGKGKVQKEEAEKGGMSLWLEKHLGEKQAFNVMLYASVTLAIVFTVGIFIVAPTAVINLFKHVIQNEVVLNLMEGVLRILLFVGYIAVISRMSDIRRVFEFHGAEHKTIHCYENNLPLTPANCQTFETLHPRCGTSFLMFVMIISLLLFSLLGWPNLLIRIASRILLIPVIAGLSYELLQWAGKSDSMLVRILSYPGLLLQKLTTKRPDDSQLEVAIAAMRAVLVKDSPAVFVGEIDTDGNLYPEKQAASQAELPTKQGNSQIAAVQETELPIRQGDSQVVAMQETELPTRQGNSQVVAMQETELPMEEAEKAE